MEKIKIYGCIKPKIKINDFVTVIFSDNNKNCYIQIYNNSKYEFKTIEVIENDFITKFEVLDEQINFDNQILAYLNEKNELIIGNKESVIKRLLPILTNDSIYPFQRYLIAKRLNISFMAKKLLYDSIEYFKKYRLNINLSYESSDDEILIITSAEVSSIKEFIELINLKINKEKETYNFSWFDYIKLNSKFIIIDKFKVHLDLLIKIRKKLNKDFFKTIISNPIASKYIENILYETKDILIFEGKSEESEEDEYKEFVEEIMESYEPVG